MTELRGDAVLEVLHRHGVQAYAEQTGGGTATILVGAVNDDTGRALVAIGPGWFAGPGWTDSRFDTEDLAVGVDDWGESEPTFTPSDWTVLQVADEVLRLLGLARRESDDYVQKAADSAVLQEAIGAGLLDDETAAELQLQVTP